MEQHVFRQRTNRGEAERSGSQVATPVSALLVPAGMVRLAVALDDQPSVDDEVNAADAPDLDLHVDGAPEHPQHEAHEGLRARLAPTVDESAD